jgi:hypothetical protein
MICPPCKKGAEVLATAAKGVYIPDVVEKAERLHAKCISPTDCPCQHQIALPGEVTRAQR